MARTAAARVSLMIPPAGVNGCVGGGRAGVSPAGGSLTNGRSRTVRAFIPIDTRILHDVLGKFSHDEDERQHAPMFINHVSEAMPSASWVG